jgi:hypothetical protein
MKNSNYQKSIILTATADEVFEAIIQRIPEWWSKDFLGSAIRKGDEFTVRFGPTFKTMRITKVVRDQRIEWLCVDQHIVVPAGIEPLKNKTEWVGTSIIWEIKADEATTTVEHTHIGLTPEVECWAICEQGWDQTLQSFANLLTTGIGQPFVQLDDEHLERAKQYLAKP